MNGKHRTKKQLTKLTERYILNKKFNQLALQTVEAEVTAVMRAQRVREGESRAEMQIVKWAAEGAAKGESRVFCDVRHTSVAGGMIVSR